MFYVPRGAIILNIFLLVVLAPVWVRDGGGDSSYRKMKEMECPVVKLSGFCVRLRAPQASTLSPSEPPLDTFLPSCTHIVALETFSSSLPISVVYLICFSVHLDLATACSTSGEVCLPKHTHSLKVLCTHLPCLLVASESPSQAVGVPHSPLKINLSQVTSYSVVTAESGQNTGLGLDLNSNPRSASLGLLGSC